MNGFEEYAVCRAPAEEVFKLLWDLDRLPDWWAGMDRVERGSDGQITRFMEAWPDFAYPTRLEGRRDGSQVRISCLLSDIVHEWTLEPHPDGCVVAIRVELPEAESHRLDAQRDEIRTSLTGLVALAERQSEGISRSAS